MYEDYKRLQKFADMVGKIENKDDAFKVVAKIILAVNEDETLINDAMAYVNDCLTYAAIENSTFYA